MATGQTELTEEFIGEMCRTFLLCLFADEKVRQPADLDDIVLGGSDSADLFSLTGLITEKIRR